MSNVVQTPRTQRRNDAAARTASERENNQARTESGAGADAVEPFDLTGPYRLDVLTSNVADVVQCAGGWLYDHAARGWHVTVMISGPANLRPLRILGVNALDLASALADPERPRPHLVGAASEQLETDPHVQQLILSELSGNNTEIVVWGPNLPPGLEEVGHRVKYRLSTTASAFKRHALLAVAARNPVPCLTEEFWSCVTSRFTPRDDTGTTDCS